MVISSLAVVPGGAPGVGGQVFFVFELATGISDLILDNCVEESIACSFLVTEGRIPRPSALPSVTAPVRFTNDLLVRCDILFSLMSLMQ